MQIMKKTRTIKNIARSIKCMLLVVMPFVCTMAAAQTNMLSVPEVEFPCGRSIQIPIKMTNSQEVCAIQFDVLLPFEMDKVTDPISGDEVFAATVNSSRTNGHSTNIAYLGTGYDSNSHHSTYLYRVMLLSAQNNMLRGTNGDIMTLQFTLPVDLEDGTTYDLGIENVKFSDRQGNAITASAQNGYVKIAHVEHPDIVPVVLDATQTTVAPGETITFNWRVENQGTAATGAGWTERLFLEDESGKRVFVGTSYYEGTLAAGANVVRQAEVTLPLLPGIDGSCRPVVTLQPASGCGELQVLQANNTAAAAAYNTTLSKTLTLNLYSRSISESATSGYYCTLSRSGNSDAAQTFHITASPVGRVVIRQSQDSPEGDVTVTGTSSTFYIYAVDNSDLNPDGQVTLTVEAAHGYAATAADIEIQDDDKAEISLALDKAEYNEGETITATVSISAHYIAGEPVRINLDIENPKRFKCPTYVTIPAGETSAQVAIKVLDDKVPASIESIKLKASAEHYSDAEALFILNDDDTPSIEMTVNPTTISEGDGVQALYCTIRRTGVTSNAVTLQISDDSEYEELIYNNGRLIDMPAGTTEINFYLGVRDNNEVDGTRQLNLKASVYVAGCNCPMAPRNDLQTEVTVPITILDNDGPSLAISVDKTTVLEGDENGVMLTVSRNTETSSALTVALQALKEDGRQDASISCPAAITIPAGSKSASVRVVANSNATEGDERVITFTAFSTDFNNGSAWVLVSDRTLPDANLTECVATAASIETGGNVTLALQIENNGAAPLPAGTPIIISMGEETVFKMGLPQAVAVGAGSGRLPVSFVAPTVPGSYEYSVKVNPSHNIHELSYQNNDAKVNIDVASVYDYTIAANKTKMTIGETVTLSGTARRGGNPVQDFTLEPYVVLYGQRTALSATTDSEGRWSVDFTVPEGLAGDWTYGVSDVGSKLTDVAGHFSVVGFVRTEYDYLKHQIFVGEPYEGRIMLRNLSPERLTNIHLASIEDLTEQNRYEVSVTPIASLGGNTAAELTYRITGQTESEKLEWERVIMHLTTDEGAKLDVTLYAYTGVHEAKLVFSETNINTTVSQGSPRNYPITLTNTGLGETGRISIAMPEGAEDLISLVTPAEMPSMATGDSVTIVLRLNGSGYDLNVTQKGWLYVNTENGGGGPINFSLKVVSEETGTLRVRVADNYTYYAASKPYVKDANVQIRDYNNGRVLYSGTSDEDGYVSFENVPAGYYQMFTSADRHDSQTRDVLVNPGTTTDVEAFVFYNAISTTWDVVETEIEDEYKIETKIVFETQVPVPVVVLTAPDTIPIYELAPGESLVYNLVARNYGLIRAIDCEVDLPSVPGFTFTPLTALNGWILSPESSKVIPVRVTRMVDPSNSRRKSLDGAACVIASLMRFAYECAARKGGGSTGDTSSPGGGFSCSVNGDGGGTGNRTPESNMSGPGGSYRLPNFGYLPGREHMFDIACCGLDCADPTPDPIERLPGGSVVSTADNLMDCHSSCMDAAAGAPRKAQGHSQDLLTAAKRKYDLYILYAKNLWSELSDYMSVPDSIPGKEAIDAYFEVYDYMKEAMAQMHTDGTLYDIDPAQIAFTSLTPEQIESMYADDADAKAQALAYHGTPMWEMIYHMPNHYYQYEDLDMQKCVERFQNYYRILDGMEPTNDNYPQRVLEGEFEQRTDSLNTALFEMGFVNWQELYKSGYDNKQEYYQNASKNMCAHVTLKIEQKLVMTRQAFRGTLTISNDSGFDLTGIDLAVRAKNSEGEVATSHEFQIEIESTDGLGGTDGDWSLKPGEKGTITVLFIPTKYAAETVPEMWSFGGDLFMHFNGEDIKRPLYDVSLEVRPSPVLDMTYFMQRDIYGDNPLTPDVTEPMVPAEFTCLIKNKGNGDATNVRMFTKQPEIVENEKELLVGFRIISSSLNGGEKAMALDETIATQFGDIPAGQCSYASWDLQSDLLGHFVDYEVSATHVTSYGNPDLSLLDEVTIHEMIHSVDANIGGTIYRAWITNDVEEGHGEPDHIYFSNGTDEQLTTLTNVTTIEKVDNHTYRVRVRVPQREWFYANVINPTGGHSKVLSVRNETRGAELSARNFWTTDYTMQDGFDPLEDHRLHVADLSDGPGEYTYLVTFEDTPDEWLQVTDIAGTPAIPDQQSIIEEPIQTFDVTFNKPVLRSSFGNDDVVLRWEGKTQNLDGIFNYEWTDDLHLRMTSTKMDQNGLFSLQVLAQGVEDQEGYHGQEGRIVKWMQYMDGMIHYNVDVWPVNTGDITMTNDDADDAVIEDMNGNIHHGTTVTLTATPEDGYEFSHWEMVDDGSGQLADGGGAAAAPRHRAAALDGLTGAGTKVSTMATIKMEMNSSQHLRAVFVPREFVVSVSADQNYVIPSIWNSIAEYGAEVKVGARPTSSDYVVTGYEVTTQPLSGEGEPTVTTYMYGTELTEGDDLTITVEGSTMVRVLFRKPARVLLSENIDFVAEATDDAYVVLYRSFRHGMWNTICLPIEVENPEATFGTGTRVARLTGMNNGTVVFETQAGSMEANVPYLIIPGNQQYGNSSAFGESEVMSFIFENTDIVEGETTDTQGNISFIGTYAEEEIEPNAGNSYISSNALYYVDQEGVMTGRFRGYFHNDTQSSMRLALLIDGDNVTGLEMTDDDTVKTVPVKIYDLTGRRLSKLRRGINIVNNKKVVVR